MAPPSGPADDALIKGGPLRELLLWYESRYGRDYVPDVIARLTPAHALSVSADKLTLGLVPSVWYPAPIVHAILDALVERHTPEELHEIVRESNAFVVRRMTKGLYQFLFRMVGSPELYARHIQRAWNMLHSTGRREIVLGDGVAESTIDDWPGHHPWLCEVTTETMRAVFEAMGCREVEVERVACVSKGDRRCKSILRYRES
ncbi:MAG: hypothetical protein HOV80_12035 [Polyangiaceae bacterium]|nr:hypothetical protein [Polyangiaceae bacterium]